MSNIFYHIARLNPTLHERAGFDCGVDPLNRYLRERAAQDSRRKIAGCWVLTQDEQPGNVLGFYTLSAEAVDLRELGAADPEAVKRLPRYPRVGAVLLGRLAVAKSQHRNGLGELLLYDAMHRVLHTEIPAALMVADPKDGQAGMFYQKHGFEWLNAERLFITMQRISDMLGKPDSHR
ncbi:MAG: GNAT family N-acetyltransferase [Verrucomicrobia bacterium]|nr:GNAT family N-acetyltransferase [Verrucomicrobiota bacterium]